MMFTLRLLKFLFGMKDYDTIARVLELERTHYRSDNKMKEEKQKIETKPKLSNNSIYADINSAKDVLLLQVLMEIASDPFFKVASAKEKDNLKKRLEGIFALQFDQLIARLQKKMS
jgi:hypothetical protein